MDSTIAPWKERPFEGVGEDHPLFAMMQQAQAAKAQHLARVAAVAGQNAFASESARVVPATPTNELSLAPLPGNVDALAPQNLQLPE